MHQIIFATLMMLVLVGTNVACNTVHGLGQAARWNLRKISLGQMLRLASHDYRPDAISFQNRLILDSNTS